MPLKPAESMTIVPESVDPPTQNLETTHVPRGDPSPVKQQDGLVMDSG